MSEFFDPKEAKVYVGTYAKYNAGSLAGKWVTLSDFSTYEEFIDECKRIHADEDEDELELMFQDCENLPDCFYSESEISKKFWEFLEECDDYCDCGNAYIIYLNYRGEYVDVDEFEENLIGAFDSDEDFGIEIAENWGYLEGVPESVKMYFDYEAFARDLLINDCFKEEGYYFKRKRY